MTHRTTPAACVLCGSPTQSAGRTTTGGMERVSPCPRCKPWSGSTRDSTRTQEVEALQPRGLENLILQAGVAIGSQ